MPHRLDPRTGQPILSPVVVFDGGSRWSSPLHACASTVRTAIKTVTFRYNTTIAGPEHGLAGLRVVNITQRSYPTNEQAPLWGIEETGLDLDGVSPVWGLIDERYAEIANLTAKRAPHLYLVGLAAGTFAPGLHEALIGSAGYQNLPGADFPIYTMNTVYRNLASLPYDLTGKGSAAIFARWQQLSRTAETAQDIIHLAWTDLAASAVAGTKGVLGPLNGMRLSGGPADFASNGTAPPTSGDGTVTLPPAQQVDNIDFTVQVEVQPIVRRIKYRLPYAIPAFLVAAIMLGSIMAVAIFAVTGRSSFAAVSRRLRETSVGRVWRSILDPSRSNLAQPTKEWALLNAAEPVDVGPAPGNRNGAVVGTTAVYNGKLEHESAMNGYHSPSLYPRKPVASDNAYQ